MSRLVVILTLAEKVVKVLCYRTEKRQIQGGNSGDRQNCHTFGCHGESMWVKRGTKRCRVPGTYSYMIKACVQEAYFMADMETVMEPVADAVVLR